jgi:hypothetical protein
VQSDLIQNVSRVTEGLTLHQSESLNCVEHLLQRTLLHVRTGTRSLVLTESALKLTQYRVSFL